MKRCGINSWEGHTRGHINSQRERKHLRVPQERGGGGLQEARAHVCSTPLAQEPWEPQGAALFWVLGHIPDNYLCLSTPAAHTQSCMAYQRVMKSVNTDT